MTYYDKQGNEIDNIITWALIAGDDDNILADDSIDGFHVETKFWGTTIGGMWRSFVRDQDGEEVDGASYPTEAVALQGHQDLCETLREMATDGGRPC